MATRRHTSSGFRMAAAAVMAGLAVLAGLLAAPQQSDARPSSGVRSLGYAFLVNPHGGWTGPKAGGDPARWVVDRLIEAHPSHLRISTAANKCTSSECYTMQPNSPAIRRELRRLRDAGIQLGAAINTARGPGGKRSVADVVDHACRMKQADDDNLYSWLFLDFLRSQPQRLKIANRIRSGKGCPAGGWRIVTNSSGYRKSIKMPRGAVVHAKRFSILVGRKSAVRKRLIAASRGKRPVLAASDRRFLQDVKRKYPESWPVLKLEVPHQTGGIFARLSTRVQRNLLRRWARASRRQHFKIMHPLFVFPAGSGHNEYDSVAEGTFDLIKDLIDLDGR